jgi:uncharacterized protein with NAD-binding domain and iron-sulfur cluster
MNVNINEIAISGAGISGLCAAIILLSKGFDITIFEEGS